MHIVTKFFLQDDTPLHFLGEAKLKYNKIQISTKNVGFSTERYIFCSIFVFVFFFMTYFAT